MKNTALSKIEIVALFRKAIRDLTRAVCQGIPSALAVTLPEEYQNQAESAIVREIAQRFQVASEATFLAIDASAEARSAQYPPGHYHQHTAHRFRFLLQVDDTPHEQRSKSRTLNSRKSGHF